MNRVAWYDVVLVAYLDVIPVVSLVSGVVMAAGLLFGLLRGRIVGWVAVPGLVAAALLTSFSYSQTDSTFVLGAGQSVAPMLAAAAVLAIISWSVQQRASVRAAK